MKFFISIVDCYQTARKKNKQLDGKSKSWIFVARIFSDTIFFWFGKIVKLLFEKRFWTDLRLRQFTSGHTE